MPTPIRENRSAVPPLFSSATLAKFFDRAQTTRGEFLAQTALLGLALRLIVVAFVFHGVAAPSTNHAEFGAEMGWTARSIVLGRGFSSPFQPFTGPTALVPPLYPYLIAEIQKIFGLYTAKSAGAILSLNSVLSALTAIPVYFSTRAVLRERVARAAAMVWAVYPFSIYFSAYRVWDYALTAALLSVSFWAAQTLHRRRMAGGIGFGALCGVATLSNPAVLPVLAPAGLLALYRAREAGRSWLRLGACAALMLGAVCSPWIVRNQRTFHQPTFIRDGFWLEFWAGNNGDTFESNPGWAHPASNPAEMRQYQAVSEPEYMAEKRRLGLNFVRQHPGSFALLSLRRAFCFWTGFWSLDRKYLAQDPTEIPDFFYCGAVSLLAFLGAWRWWRVDVRTALAYVLPMALFPLTYYVTHSSPDYRQPLEPILVVLAVVGALGPDADDETPGASAAADDEVDDERFAVAS